MRRFFYLTSILLLGFNYSCHRGKLLEKPNVLFIFTDDQRYNTVGAIGDKQLITPNMDKLALSGVSFTHSYNMGAWHGAVCVASRAMLNTGLSVWHAKNAEPGFSELAANRQFWAQRMSDLGYETYFSGKWHVNARVEDIFDHVRHERPGMPNQTPAGYNRPKDSTDVSWLPWDTAQGGYWKGGKHWSEVLVEDAELFLSEAAKSDKPFFMYLAFNAPHDPRQSPKSYVDLYPLENLELPVSYLPEYPYKDSIGCSSRLRDEALAPFPRTAYAVKVNQQEYFALISHTDTQIGKILNALETHGFKDNTYILWTADHGLALGNHGLMGKQNLYDHSIRVPLVISGPGIPENEIRVQQVYLQDVMPTALQLAGSGDLPSVEFRSLLPLIFEKEESYAAIYGCYMNLQRMVRTERYKLLLYPKIPLFRLYDLQEDPNEMNDLASDPAFKDLLEQLKQQMIEQQKLMEDPLDISGLWNE